MDPTDLRAACEEAVVSLHRFFVDWFRGACADSDEVWHAFEGALAPGFVLVSPGGQVHAREPLAQGLRGLHGQHRARRFEIEVRNVVLHHATEELVVVGYEEWQQIAEQRTARQSTAVFQRSPAGSANLRWAHVHETWLPDGSP